MYICTESARCGLRQLYISQCTAAAGPLPSVPVCMYVASIPFSFSGYYPPRPMYSGVGGSVGLNHAAYKVKALMLH